MNEAEQEEFAAASLQFVLTDSGVTSHGQVSIAPRYGSMRKFRAAGDTRAEVRRACLTDFAILHDTPDSRAEAAAVVSAWEVAQEYNAKEVEIRAEAKVLGQPMQLLVQERMICMCTVLNIEHKLRKEAMKLVVREGVTLADSLAGVIRDAELKETYFTTPVALRAAMSSHAGGFQQNKVQRSNRKGSSKSSPPKGKGKSGKGKGKEIRKELQLAWRTPDNRELRFGYDAGTCSGKCDRVHQCRVKGCYGDHPAFKHKVVTGA
eukprot:s26_g27.t1